MIWCVRSYPSGPGRWVRSVPPAPLEGRCVHRRRSVLYPESGRRDGPVHRFHFYIPIRVMVWRLYSPVRESWRGRASEMPSVRRNVSEIRTKRPECYDIIVVTVVTVIIVMTLPDVPSSGRCDLRTGSCGGARRRFRVGSSSRRSASRWENRSRTTRSRRTAVNERGRDWPRLSGSRRQNRTVHSWRLYQKIPHVSRLETMNGYVSCCCSINQRNKTHLIY